MKIRSATTINRQVREAALATILLLMILTGSAPAVQWQELAQTERHKVAIDADSVQLTTNGRLAIWLRFIPRGERRRKEAMKEYGTKDYRLHFEYYEIDCADNSAFMGQIDILGTGGKRLDRRKGEGELETIIAGSTLDRTAQRICPELEDAATDGDETTVKTTDSSMMTSPVGKQLSEEANHRIEESRRRTEISPDDDTAWIELGNAYFDADLPKQSIEAYYRALALKPDNPDVLNDQGAMYREAGDVKHALDNFEKALSLDPSNLESLYNMGYIYAFDLNRIKPAMNMWQRYLLLDSSSERARQIQTFTERYGKESSLPDNSASQSNGQKD